jgi:hypothetical protein
VLEKTVIEETMIRILRGYLVIFIFAILTVFGSTCFAQQLYYTSEPLMTVDQLNFSSGSIQQLVSLSSITGKVDSIIVNSQGQIIYDIPVLDEVWMFDPSTGTNTLLISGVSYARDLVIEPGGATMLIALNATGEIARYNFSTGAVTILSKKLLSVNGLAYDSNGDLFAVVDKNQVCQIDPVAGTEIQCLVLEPHSGQNGGDGMVYDPYSGLLWISHDGTMGNGLAAVPTDLSTVTFYQTGNIRVPDGITTDGQGNLYIAAGLQWIVEYNIPTDTIVKKVKAPGVDSVAMVPATQ